MHRPIYLSDGKYRRGIDEVSVNRQLYRPIGISVVTLKGALRDIQKTAAKETSRNSTDTISIIKWAIGRYSTDVSTDTRSSIDRRIDRHINRYIDRYIGRGLPQDT